MFKNILFSILAIAVMTFTCDREIDRMKDQDATQRADSITFTRQDTTDLDMTGTEPELEIYWHSYDSMAGKKDTIRITY